MRPVSFWTTIVWLLLLLVVAATLAIPAVDIARSVDSSQPVIPDYWDDEYIREPDHFRDVPGYMNAD